MAWHDLGIWQIQCETSDVSNIPVELALRTAMPPALAAVAVETFTGTIVEDEAKALGKSLPPILEFKWVLDQFENVMIGQLDEYL